MLKVTGLNELAQGIAYNEIIRTHEARAKKSEIKARANEIKAAGVDPELAKVMAKVFTEYGI